MKLVSLLFCVFLVVPCFVSEHVSSEESQALRRLSSGGNSANDRKVGIFKEEGGVEGKGGEGGSGRREDRAVVELKAKVQVVIKLLQDAEECGIKDYYPNSRIKDVMGNDFASRLQYLAALQGIQVTADTYAPLVKYGEMATWERWAYAYATRVEAYITPITEANPRIMREYLKGADFGTDRKYGEAVETLTHVIEQMKAVAKAAVPVKQGENGKAVDAGAIWKNVGSVYARRAQAYTQVGRYEEAIANYREAIERNWEVLDMYFELGEVYETHLKDYVGASKLYAQGIVRAVKSGKPEGDSYERLAVQFSGCRLRALRGEDVSLLEVEKVFEEIVAFVSGEDVKQKKGEELEEAQNGIVEGHMKKYDTADSPSYLRMEEELAWRILNSKIS